MMEFSNQGQNLYYWRDNNSSNLDLLNVTSIRYSGRLPANCGITSPDENPFEIKNKEIGGATFSSVYRLLIDEDDHPDYGIAVFLHDNHRICVIQPSSDDGNTIEYDYKSCYFKVDSGAQAYQKASRSHFEPTNYYFKSTANGRTYYFRIFVEKSDHSMSSASLVDTSNPTKTTFKPLETLSNSDRERTVTANVTTYTFDSISFSVSTETYTNQGFSVSSGFKESYDTTGVKTLKYEYPYFDDGVLRTVSKTWSITISAWDSEVYSIERNQEVDYTLYAYKSVFDSNLLSAYKLILTKTSTGYGSIVQTIQNTLEKARMENYTEFIPDGSNTFTFDYNIEDINGQTISFDTNASIVKLKSGNDKFSNFSRKTTFGIGDEVSDSSEYDLSTVYLTYTDNTTIAASEVLDTFGVSCTLGQLPFTIAENTTPSFSITYSFESSLFDSNFELTDSCSVINEEIDQIVLYNFQHIFNQNETIGFNNNATENDYAYIEVYNSNGSLLETIDQANFATEVSIVEPSTSKFGKTVQSLLVAAEYDLDGEFSYQLTCRGKTVSVKIGFTYYMPTLAIGETGVKQTYYFDASITPFVFDFDYTNMTATVVKYTSTYDSTNDTVSTSSSEVDVVSSVTKTHDTIDKTKALNYNVTISYAGFGTPSTGSIAMWASPILPDYIDCDDSPSLSPNTTLHYYDSGVTKFKLPTDLTFKLHYNCGDSEKTPTTINISDLYFYRKTNRTNILTAGSDYILPSDGQRIYFYSPDYDLESSYAIRWDQDSITAVNFKNMVLFYKGDPLRKAKPQVTLVVSYTSGLKTVEISDVNSFDFVNTNIIHTDPLEKLYVTIPDLGFDSNNPVQIQNSITTATSPKAQYLDPYAVIEVDLRNFPTEYNNKTDAIYTNRIIAKTKYYKTRTGTSPNYVYSDPCEFEQSLSFKTGSLDSATQFNVAVLNSDPLYSYTFNSGTAVAVTLSENESYKASTLLLAAENRYTNTSVSKSIDIKIIEILNITGIKLIHAKNEYIVGETFLNDEDDTEVMLFYPDINDNTITRTYTVKLRQNITALNIYPLKGTKFNLISSGKVITVSAAANHNVSVQYTLDVKPKYVYGDTRTHNLVVVKFDSYNTGILDDSGNEIVISEKYMIVERNMALVAGVETNIGTEVTYINENGERVPASGYGYNNLVVRGYLDDTDDEGKMGKVILFQDYVPPVDGSSNISIKFPYYQMGIGDAINKCHFGILFGNNNAKNRLFVSGNPDTPNCDWYSGMVNEYTAQNDDSLNGNFGYFEDTSWCYYGETDNKIIGYAIVSNDKLLVLKDYSDKETTVYFRTPTLVTALDSSGNEMTGVAGERLYQDEFALVKGNNSVAGISPKAIVDFVGDSVFLSKDKQLVGLDLAGIVGDNQRYASTRSYYIDEDLKKQNLEGAFLWSNNKYLFIVLKEKIYVTHHDLKDNNQYEWFVIDVPNVTSVFELNGITYFGDSKGDLFKFVNKLKDARKVFAGYGISRITVNDVTELITATGYLSQLDPDSKYLFRPIPFAGTEDYIYYSLGTLVNNSSADCDFYVNNGDSRNLIELICVKNGQIDFERMSYLLKIITEKEPVFLNRINNGVNGINVMRDSDLANAWGKKFYLREYTDENSPEKHLYQVYDADGDLVKINDILNARLCMRITEETEMSDINIENGTFKLKKFGKELDIVQYDNQSLISAFRGEIIEYRSVEAFYITSPQTLGSLEFLKTIWSFTVTNDTNIPSEIDLCIVTNKIPQNQAKSLVKFAPVSKDGMEFDLADLTFDGIDFDKNTVPRTYTSKKILPRIKFVCFCFKNYNSTDSVLSSMSMTYSLPYPSYGGD